MWYLVNLIWEKEDFLCLGCLHTDLSACIFPGSCLKTTYPKQTCGSVASHSIFPEIELFPCSGELAEALCYLPWYSDASREAQRRYIFTVYRAKILVVRTTARWGMWGERTVFLFLFFLSVLLVSGCSCAVASVCCRSAAEGSLWASLACRPLWWRMAGVAKAAISF